MKDWFIIFSACICCTAILAVYLKYRLKDIEGRLSNALSDVKQKLSEINQSKQESAEPAAKTFPINSSDASSSSGNSGEAAALTNGDNDQKRPEADVDLLEDKAWVKLMENVFFIQERLNNEAAQLDLSQQSNDFIDFLNAKFEELYQRNNLTPIQGDNTFDWNRHKPADSQSPDNNDPIEKTITPGWRYNDRIFRRAIVSATNKNNEEIND